ncbi:MAG TPA: hypothetical protein VHQ65_00535 [Thermoanaerobaculia bacterium]|nr:hypothetical protein [Thermoanaerobaculia bacterium]
MSAQPTLSAIAALTLFLTLPALAEQGPAACEDLLQKADRLRSTDRALEAKSLYERLLDTCADAELPDSLWAEVATRRGEFTWFYGNDRRGASEIFEAHLETLTARTGADDAARLPLLEALAEVSSALALDSDNDRAASDLQRAFDLYAEALRVRELAYGERSLEAADGLDRVAAVHLLENPAKSADLFRRSFEIRKEKLGLYHQEVLKSLPTLREALRMQGKEAEAADVLTLYEDIADTLDRQKG